MAIVVGYAHPSLFLADIGQNSESHQIGEITFRNQWHSVIALYTDYGDHTYEYLLAFC